MAHLVKRGVTQKQFKPLEALCGVRGDSVVLYAEDLAQLHKATDEQRRKFVDQLLGRMMPENLK